MRTILQPFLLLLVVGGVAVAEPGETRLSCVTGQCHAVFSRLARPHGPVAVGDCTACHSPHRGKAKPQLLAAGSALCFRCHEQKEINLHEGATQHRALQKGCTVCHAPHGGAAAHFVRQEAGVLCQGCHAQRRGSAAPNVATRELCASCHDPHASKQPRLLRRGRGAAPGRCPRPPAAGGKDQPTVTARLAAPSPGTPR